MQRPSVHLSDTSLFARYNTGVCLGKLLERSVRFAIQQAIALLGDINHRFMAFGYVARFAITISEQIPQDEMVCTYSICHARRSSIVDRCNGLHPPTRPGLRS